MRNELTQQLDPIFNAKFVAIIGASNNPTKWGGTVMNRVLESDFRGQIYPINPRESEIFGIKPYADVGQIPGPVDLAVFTIPAQHMPSTMESCVAKGTPGGLVGAALLWPEDNSTEFRPDVVVGVSYYCGYWFENEVVQIEPWACRSMLLDDEAPEGMFGPAIDLMVRTPEGFAYSIRVDEPAGLIQIGDVWPPE